MPLFSSRRPAPAGNGFAVDAANIHVLHDAKSFHQQLLQQIAQAQQRIHLCSLYLQHDEGGESILLALHQAKQQRPQLDIRVFVDFHRARRGLIGAGTLFAGIEMIIPGTSAINVLGADYPGFLVAILPPGAFFALGMLIAAFNAINVRLAARARRQPPPAPKAPEAQDGAEPAAAS